MSTRAQWAGLAGFIVVTFAVSAIASLATMPAIPSWYAGLRKPSWTPPSWVFGPVWTVLYLAMAVAAWLVWRRTGFGGPIALYGVQLLLNMLWSILFFGLRQPGWALLDILLLWVAIAATMLAFRRVASAAGWLFVPYLLWVSYAATLNWGIWRMNP